ncbi:MAG: integration host factor subunit alpha [Desulfobacterales bacterium CG23_combo_of_CG06-09_8_20_14_all_51_8]|nr:MAG: integration host factor subunit alpha [Desulfobacterales bacterium CG23_combo_of_CG06-09_8_20_14_all_51_8]
MALTKNRMIEKIMEETKLTKKKASDSVEAIIEVMKSALASGDDVLVSGFGKFCVNEKNKRKGRNPATGKELMLDGRKVLTFRCSGILRDQINGE